MLDGLFVPCGGRLGLAAAAAKIAAGALMRIRGGRRFQAASARVVLAVPHAAQQLDGETVAASASQDAMELAIGMYAKKLRVLVPG